MEKNEAKPRDLSLIGHNPTQQLPVKVMCLCSSERMRHICMQSPWYRRRRTRIAPFWWGVPLWMDRRKDLNPIKLMRWKGYRWQELSNSTWDECSRLRHVDLNAIAKVACGLRVYWCMPDNATLMDPVSKGKFRRDCFLIDPGIHHNVYNKPSFDQYV